MKVDRRAVGGLWLAAIAFGAWYLASWLPQFLAEFRRAYEFSPLWAYLYLGVVSIAGTACVASVTALVWTWAAAGAAKHQRRQDQARNPSRMTIAEREAETASQLDAARTLVDDASLPSDAREPLRAMVAEFEQRRQSQKLEIVAFGTVSSGKSSLLNALAGREVFRTDPKGGTTTDRSELSWPGNDRVVLVDTPGLAEIGGDQRASLAKRVARDADLVLLVVDGPLKDFEHDVLAQLAQMEKRVVICLNKEDWFQPQQRQRLVDQLTEQSRALVQADDVIAVRAAGAARSRVRVLPSGQEIEEPVAAEPDISQLAERILTIMAHDGRDLLAANLLLQARGLVADARARIQSVLDERARALVDRTMWQAGAVAALSPLPLVDIAASLAITSNMVVSLARLYGQTIDLETINRLLTELGKNLLAILGTTAATPAVASIIASLLKGVPGVGTLAGGALQGLVQALLTRWIGRIFIDYFRREMREPDQGWAALARAQWDEITRPAELARFVQLGLKRLGGRGV